MTKLQTGLIAAVLAVLAFGCTTLGSTERAQAQGLYPAVGYGYGGIPFGQRAIGPSLHSLGRIPVPPYFALHPPVYYSRPVPRTYGYSPFAYPGIVATPEVRVEPLTVENPFYDGPTKEKTKNSNSGNRPGPLTLANPYVEQDALAGNAAPLAEVVTLDSGRQ